MSRDRGGGLAGLSLETKYRHAISEFRRRHVAAFEKLFVEVLRLASASGLLKVGRLALDGTKIKAFSEIASRHGLVSNRAMSYDRMQTEEVRLQQEIRELLARASQRIRPRTLSTERTVAVMNCRTSCSVASLA